MKADRTWARKLVLAPLLLGLTLLAACTGETEPPVPSRPGDAVPKLAAVDVNAQSREALEPGGELRIGVPGLPENWNPLSRAQIGRDLSSLYQAVFPRFFVADAEGNLTPDPNFLLSAEVTSQSPTKVALKLNPKAVWGDGRAVTALDVAATVKACSGADTSFACASTAGYDQIASVKPGRDNFEAVVTYRGTVTDWTLPFSTVGTLRAATVASPRTFDEALRELNPQSTSGPFVAAGFDPATSTLAAVPNPRWWGDTPLLERITWRAVAPDQQAKLFTAGTIDTFVSAQDPQQAATLTEDPQVHLRQALGPQVRLLQFSRTGALKQVADRRSVAMALDRTALATEAVRGLDGWPALVVNNHIFALNSPDYTDEAASSDIKPDPAAAQARLNGRGLQLRMAVPKGDPVAATEANLIKAQLAAVGVQVRVDAVADWNNALTSEVYDLTVVDSGPTAYPLALDARYARGQASNVVGPPAAALDADLDTLRSSAGPARTDAAKRTATTLWSQMPGVPLYQRPSQVVVRGDLANWGASGPVAVSWTDVGYPSSE